MRIAVLSDIHDNVWNLTAALDKIKDVGVGAFICCGDLCSPFVAKLILEAFREQPVPVVLVWGNNDADTARITALAKPYPFLQVHHELAELIVVDDRLLSRQDYGKAYFGAGTKSRRLAVTHYDNIALPLAKSGLYDVVFFGHNHKYEVTALEKTLAVNPGPIMGYSPLVEGGREVDATFIIYDPETDDVWGYRIALEASGSRSVHSYP